MKALVIKPKNASEIKFLSQLLSKMGVSSSLMDWEEMEDYGMSILMRDVDRNNKVSKADVMKKLSA